MWPFKKKSNEIISHSDLDLKFSKGQSVYIMNSVPEPYEVVGYNSSTGKYNLSITIAGNGLHTRSVEVFGEEIYPMVTDYKFEFGRWDFVVWEGKPYAVLSTRFGWSHMPSYRLVGLSYDVLASEVTSFTKDSYLPTRDESTGLPRLPEGYSFTVVKGESYTEIDRVYDLILRSSEDVEIRRNKSINLTYPNGYFHGFEHYTNLDRFTKLTKLNPELVYVHASAMVSSAEKHYEESADRETEETLLRTYPPSKLTL